MEKVNEDASLDVKWLVKRGVGGKKKEVRFYASFIYDEVEYALNDCVYMYKEGLREPYLGKLTKIWENGDKTKKVKIHWFFRPEEISKWLGDTKTLENELFIACGEGVGLANICPLEAIAGKCDVVCISKDSRNPQPSDEELKAADFVFYRTFDVESCTISDNMGVEKVGGIEIKDVFNRRSENESIITLPETTSDTKEENQITKTLPNNLKDDRQDSQDKDVPILASETTSVEKSNSKKDEKSDKEVGTVSANKVEVNKRKNTPTGSENLQDQPLKKTKLDDKNPPKEKQIEVEADRDSEKLKDTMPLKKSKVDHVNNVKASVTAGKNSETGKTVGSNSKVDKDNSKLIKYKNESKVSKVAVDKERVKSPPPNAKEVDVGGDIEKMTDLPSKKSKVDGKSKDEDKLARSVGNLKEERPNVKNEKGNTKISDKLEGRVLKKSKAEGSFKIPDDKKNISTDNVNGNKSNNGKNSVVATEGKSKSSLDVGPVVGTNKENNISSESKKKLAVSKSAKDMYREFVVGPKPKADTNSWFKPRPWDVSLKNAYDQGTAVLLHNIDPDYNSKDVENLIWHAFNENCEAKILPHSAISSQDCYQAMVLLKTKEAAQRVLTKLDAECLMLSNGRPLVGTPCPPIIPRSNCKFFGHLVIDRIKINQREDEAVSSSHFSQPNTIEYDMAMEWFLLQSKSTKWWEMTNKLHGDELKELEAKLVKK